jgi:hypothetical protein
MKNSIILILFSLFIAFLLNTCVDEVVVDGPNKQGKLIVSSDPPGAKIYLMGTNTNQITPDSLLGLESGDYQLTLKKDGCCDTTFKVKVYDRLTTSVFTKLIKEKEFGNLFLESIPSEALIYLSGVNTNKITPDSILKMETGEYQVTLMKDKFIDTTFNAVVFKDSTTSVLIELKNKEPGRGNLSIESVPNGAKIFLSGTDTKKLTPDSITNIIEGNYEVTLTKENYADTTFNVNIADKHTTAKIITLLSTKTTGSVFLQSIPSGAQIFVSGTNTNKTTPEGIINLEAGDHEFTLKLNGYIDTTFNVTVVKDGRTDKTIILRSTSGSGSVLLESSPSGAQIFLSGINTNKLTPSTIQNLDEGANQFTLKLNNYRDTTFNVTIIRDQQVNKNITLTGIVSTGSVLLESSPSGAQIFLSGTNTNKLTPSTIQNLTEGIHQFTLKLNNYRDTTFNVTIIRDQQVNKNITLTGTVPTGSVLLESSPSGAQIFLSGTNTNKLTPTTIQNLAEGIHQFTLKLNGYKDTTFNVNIIRNQQANKNITLTKEITAGSLLLESTPSGAQIFLSGTNTNKLTPSTIQNLEEGVHQFTLKLGGYYDTTFNVNIIRNQQVNKNIILTKEITTGSLLLESTPSGAQIFMSGTNTNKLTPSTIQNLEEGVHQFTLKLNGYYDTTFNVNIIRNQQVNKSIVLTQEVLTGSLSISSEPSGAGIYLNNKNMEKITPNTFTDLMEGSYSVTLKLEFYRDTTINAQVVRRQLTSKNIILTDASPVKIDLLQVRVYFLQTRFTFSFDQDVLLDKVEIFEPNGGGSNVFNYSNQNIKKGSSTVIYYSKVVNGTWKLVFYGKKAKDNKTDFVIEELKDVP